MLASPGKMPSGDTWAFEPKWDGFRLTAATDGEHMTLRTRPGREVTVSFPELHALPDHLAGRSLLLDGELVDVRPDGVYFYGLASRLSHRTPRGAAQAASQAPVTFMAFDLLWLDGESLCGLPYRERRSMLQELRLRDEQWQTTPSVDDGATLFAVCQQLRLEGVVAKRLNGRYLPGRRSRGWVKVKTPDWKTFHAARRLPSRVVRTPAS